MDGVSGAECHCMSFMWLDLSDSMTPESVMISNDKVNEHL